MSFYTYNFIYILYYFQALSASNLELVMFVCENAHPLNIFSQDPIPLNQPVLLSLISQLSANFDKNFELKIK